MQTVLDKTTLTDVSTVAAAASPAVTLAPVDGHAPIAPSWQRTRPVSSIETDYARIVGRNVYRYRTCARMTKSELARAAGISRQIIYKVEEGTANLRMGSLARIADALGVDPVDLMGA